MSRLFNFGEVWQGSPESADQKRFSGHPVVQWLGECSGLWHSTRDMKRREILLFWIINGSAGPTNPAGDEGGTQGTRPGRVPDEWKEAREPQLGYIENGEGCAPRFEFLFVMDGPGKGTSDDLNPAACNVEWITGDDDKEQKK